MGMRLTKNVIDVGTVNNCIYVGKLFSHSLQSVMPMRIQSVHMGTRICKERENNFPTILQFTVQSLSPRSGTEVVAKRVPNQNCMH